MTIAARKLSEMGLWNKSLHFISRAVALSLSEKEYTVAFFDGEESNVLEGFLWAYGHFRLEYSL